ncbi:hypothetical protein BJX61DRAFT_316452 [Aspergillus egyptiacus]|nr:hypothetical protein BJX61DRAFT_316452 [Aspergillus egyptiacus]
MTTQAPIPAGKAKAKAEPIRNPRRLLILSPSSHSLSLIPSLLKTLTGNPVAETQSQLQTFAGYTTHPPLRIENRYYTAEVPIWVDEIPTTATATSIATDTESGTGSNNKEDHPATATATATAESETKTTPKTGSSTKPAEELPPAQWAREFSSEEARVVRDAIGAVMICIRNPSHVSSSSPGVAEAAPPAEDREDVCALKGFINAVGSVRALIEEERGEIGAVPALLVLNGKGQGQDQRQARRGEERREGSGGFDADFETDGGRGDGLGLDEPFSIGWWEDQLCEMGLIGFEVVEWNGTRAEEEDGRRNQYGELQGMRRIKEILETHEWAGEGEKETGGGLPDDDNDNDDELERELLGLDTRSGFNLEVNELEREMVGLRFAVGRHGDGGGEDEEHEGDEEIRVDAVEALLMRMRAIKEMSDELPEKDRKQFAAKAVRDIMKEI